MMEMKASSAALTVTLQQLARGAPVETELAFLESLTSNSHPVSDYCSWHNGGIFSSVSVFVTPCSDDLGPQDGRTHTDRNWMQNSAAKLDVNEVEEKLHTSSCVPNGGCHNSVSSHSYPAKCHTPQASETACTGCAGIQETETDKDLSPHGAEEGGFVPDGHHSELSSSSRELHTPDLCTLCHDPCLAADFVEYVFTRRFGSADKALLEDENGASDGQTEPIDQQAEESVNEKIDAVINRIVEQPVTAELASAFTRLLVKASDMPTLRFKTVEHVVVWLGGIRKSGVDGTTYSAVKSLIMAGVTDVWSAVRKTCSNVVPKVFRVWSPQQQEDFFSSLLEMCINSESSWQSKDGAALCVSAIMYNCFTTESDMDTDKGTGVLPSFFVECVLTIVFSLISHPQLSIRETVAKVMSAYMKHVDCRDMVDLLHQTLRLLTPSSRKDTEGEFEYVEAYAAEGLLNICISIVKVLPVRQVVRLWPIYRNMLLIYLSHDASSVRQTSSTVFLQLASKPESSAVLTKVVMHHMTKDWCVDADSIATCTDFLQGVSDGMGTWEAREGRMFVYELLCKHLIDNHLELAQSSAKLPVKSNASDVSSSGLLGAGDDCAREVCVAVRQLFSGLSSLTQLRLLDNPHLLAQAMGTWAWGDAQHQNLQWWLLAHPASLSDNLAEPLSWQKEGHLPAFRDLLLTVLHHTAICLAHPQWELRRIAQQVLPCLCEVMCLYDVGLVMAVWQYASVEANLWSFLGLYTLRESLTHCAHVVATADLSDKTSALKGCVYVELVDGMRKHVEDYLPLVSSHLRRPVFDKLSVISAEIAVLAINFFDLEESLKEDLSQAVLLLWRNLFTFAHPTSAISTRLFESPGADFASSYEGFLSCSLVRPETKIQCARQMEKSLVLAINKQLPHFLPQLDCHNAASCLPVLAHNIGLFIDDTEICRSLINSFSILCQCTSMSLASTLNNEDVEDTSVDQSLKCVYFTLCELAAIIAMKSLDMVLLQKVLSCYISLCRLLNPAVHLALLLRGVCARLNEGRSFHLDTAEKPNLDVDLRWHKAEIPTVGGDDHHHSLDNSTQDTSLGHEQSESDSLNQSGSSYGARLCPRMGRRRTLSISGDALLIHEVMNHLGDGDEDEEESEESESDWDSWSDEENKEEISVLKTHFQDFFHQIQSVYGSECHSLLDAERQRLSRKDQDLLTTLISK